jgi:hypothetical protein
LFAVEDDFEEIDAQSSLKDQKQRNLVEEKLIQVRALADQWIQAQTSEYEEWKSNCAKVEHADLPSSFKEILHKQLKEQEKKLIEKLDSCKFGKPEPHDRMNDDKRSSLDNLVGKVLKITKDQWDEDFVDDSFIKALIDFFASNEAHSFSSQTMELAREVAQRSKESIDTDYQTLGSHFQTILKLKFPK